MGRMARQLLLAGIALLMGTTVMAARRRAAKKAESTETAKAADGTGNMSKLHREELIGKISAIRDFLQNSADENAGRLLEFVGQLEREVRTKKYGLVFEEHKERIDVELENNLPVLSENKERFIDNGGELNFLIEGDNLAALKLLEKTHKGQIDLIYIDPPYNTGNKDFRYNDSYVDDKDTFRHSKWLSFMEKRLVIMRNLLKREGFICISIDDIELCELRLLCDSVFSPENFISCLPRRTKSSGKTTKDVAANHDYVLVYARNNDCVAIGGLTHTDAGFKNSDEFEPERGRYKLNQTLDYDSLQYSPSLDYPIEIDGEVFYPGGKKEDWESRQKGEHKRADWEWRWSRELFEFGLKNGFVVVKRNKGGSARIYTKTYLNANIGENESGQYEVKIMERKKHLSTLDFLEKEYSNDKAKKELKLLFSNCPFDYPKPIKLVATLAGICTNTHAQVLDCFAGSGTTGHAVMKLNAEDGGKRRFILVTNNENEICEKVTYERLKRVIRNENYKARLKYLKVDYVPITQKVYEEYADELLKHIRELVELENGLDFAHDKSIAITVTADEFTDFVNDEARLDGCKAVYVGHDVLIGAKAKRTLQKHNVEQRVIPEYYYGEE